MLLSMIKKSVTVDYLLLILIVVIGIAIRVAELWWHGPWSRDSVIYCQWANMWYDTGVMNHIAQFGAKIAPLYIGLMVCGMKFGLNAPQAGIAVNFIFGTLLILLMFHIAKESFHEKKWAFWAAIFVAVHPTAVKYSCKVLREMPFLLFTGVWILGTLKGIKYQDNRCWILSGIGAALAALVRIEGLEYVGIMGIAGLAALWSKSWGYRKIFKISLLFVVAWLGTVIILSLWWGADIEYYKEMIRFRREMTEVNFRQLR